MGTLNQHRRRPTLIPLDLREVSVAAAVSQYKACEEYLTSVEGFSVAKPEHDALEFYLKNSAYARVMQAVSPDADLGHYEPLLESYHKTVRAKSLRLFYYLLLICTRESRHLHSSASLNVTLSAKNGGECMVFTRSIRGASSDEAVEALRNTPPLTTMGRYTDHLVDVFSMGADYGLFSGGYGGKPWANVAKVLRGFVHGVLSAELMLDQGFCLAHNNGPIFNKGLLFHGFNTYELQRILDVQRAGMIPQFVATVASSYITNEHRMFHGHASNVFGSSFGGSVDWNAVQALGAKQSYVKEKAAAKKAAAAVYGPETVAIPGLTLTKVKRSKAA